MTFDEAVKQGQRTGASKATDHQAMAMFCDSALQILVGAASPRLVWEGAVKKGITFLELARLCQHDPMAVHELMWA